MPGESDHFLAQMLEYVTDLEACIPGARTMVGEFLLGQIPLSDGVKVYELADAWDEAARQLSDAYQDAKHAADGILQNWSGDGAAMQFADHWYKYLDALGSTVESTASMGEGVQGFGLEVETMKFMAVINLLMLAVTLYMIAATAVATLGLSTGGIPGAFAAFKTAMSTAFSNAIKNISSITLRTLLKDITAFLTRTLPTMVKTALPNLIKTELPNLIKTQLPNLIKQGAKNLLPKNVIARTVADRMAGRWLKSMLGKGLMKEVEKVAGREARVLLGRSLLSMRNQLAKEIEEQLLQKFSGKVGTELAERAATNSLSRLAGNELFEQLTKSTLSDYAARQIAERTFGRELATYLGTRMAFGAGLMGGGDYLAQLYEMAGGERTSIDMGKVFQRGLEGAAFGAGMWGGPSGHMIGGGLSGGLVTGITGLAQGNFSVWNTVHGAVHGAEAGALFGAQNHMQSMRVNVKMEIGQDVHTLPTERGGMTVRAFDRSSGLGTMLTDNKGIAWQRPVEGGFEYGANERLVNDPGIRDIARTLRGFDVDGVNLRDDFGGTTVADEPGFSEPGGRPHQPVAQLPALETPPRETVPTGSDGGGGGGGPRQPASSTGPRVPEQIRVAESGGPRTVEQPGGPRTVEQSGGPRTIDRPLPETEPRRFVTEPTEHPPTETRGPIETGGTRSDAPTTTVPPDRPPTETAKPPLSSEHSEPVSTEHSSVQGAERAPASSEHRPAAAEHDAASGSEHGPPPPPTEHASPVSTEHGPPGQTEHGPPGTSEHHHLEGAGAERGEDPTPRSIEQGTVRMEEHPNFPHVVAELNDLGYSLVPTERVPQVVVRHVVDREGNIVEIQHEVRVKPGMRYLDLEHELGHVHQMTERFPEGPPPNEIAGKPKIMPPKMKEWQNAVIEYHVRLEEFIRLAERGVDADILAKHAESVDEWHEAYRKRVYTGRPFEEAERAWASSHFPEIPELEQRVHDQRAGLGPERGPESFGGQSYGGEGGLLQKSAGTGHQEAVETQHGESQRIRPERTGEDLDISWQQERFHGDTSGLQEGPGRQTGGRIHLRISDGDGSESGHSEGLPGGETSGWGEGQQLRGGVREDSSPLSAGNELAGEGIVRGVAGERVPYELVPVEPTAVGHIAEVPEAVATSMEHELAGLIEGRPPGPVDQPYRAEWHPNTKTMTVHYPDGLSVEVALQVNSSLPAGHPVVVRPPVVHGESGWAQAEPAGVVLPAHAPGEAAARAALVHQEMANGWQTLHDQLAPLNDPARPFQPFRPESGVVPHEPPPQQVESLAGLEEPAEVRVVGPDEVTFRTVTGTAPAEAHPMTPERVNALLTDRAQPPQVVQWVQDHLAVQSENGSFVPKSQAEIDATLAGLHDQAAQAVATLPPVVEQPPTTPAESPRPPTGSPIAQLHILAYDGGRGGPGFMERLSTELGGTGDQVVLRQPTVPSAELAPGVRLVGAEPLPGVTGHISPLLRLDGLPKDVDVIIGYGETAGIADVRLDAYPQAKVVQIIDAVPTGKPEQVAKWLEVIGRADLVMAVGPDVAAQVRQMLAGLGLEHTPPVHELVPSGEGVAQGLHNAIHGLGEGVARVDEATFNSSLSPREVVQRQAGELPPVDEGRARVLTVTTEWTSDKGGIPTANQELTEALAATGAEAYGRVSTVDFSDTSILRAEPAPHVHVLGVKEVWGVLNEKGQPDTRALCILPENLPPDADVVVGNSRFGGGAAKWLVEHIYPDAKYVHVLHTSPEVLDALRGDPVQGLRHADTEHVLMRGADLVAGVGPLLGKEAARLSLEASPGSPPPVHEIISDMPAIPGDPPPRPPERTGYEIHVRGRASDPIKGVDFAGKLVAELRSQGMDVSLSVRGAPKETVALEQATHLAGILGADPERVTVIESGAEYAVSIDDVVTVKVYTKNPDHLLQDLYDADLVAMPSIFEGFGLVASEAARAGLPIVVGEGTGAGLFFGDPHYVPPHLGEAATVRDGITTQALRDALDRVTEPDGTISKAAVKAALEQIDQQRLQVWTNHVTGILESLAANQERALELRAYLAEHYPPGTAGHRLLEAMHGDHPGGRGAVAPPVAPQSGPSAVAPHTGPAVARHTDPPTVAPAPAGPVHTEPTAGVDPSLIRSALSQQTPALPTHESGEVPQQHPSTAPVQPADTHWSGMRYVEQPASPELAATYDLIRGAEGDAPKIAQLYGIQPDVVQQVKQHVFLTEHHVPVGPSQVVRGFFTPDEIIADLWVKANNGTLTPGETEAFHRLLAHEYVESKLMEGGMPYRSAHPDAYDADGVNFASAEHYGAHDVAPNPNTLRPPLAHWRRYGLDPSTIVIASDLSNLDEVVAAILRGRP